MTGRSSRAAPPAATVILVLAAAVVAPAPLQPVGAQSRVMQQIQYGEIVSIRDVVIREQPTGEGATIGATAGAVAGYALADHGDRWLGGLLGGVLGGAAGKSIEKASRKKKGWELIIRVDGAGEIGIQVPVNRQNRKNGYRTGQRVRLLTTPGGQTEVVPLDE